MTFKVLLFKTDVRYHEAERETKCLLIPCYRVEQWRWGEGVEQSGDLGTW